MTGKDTKSMKGGEKGLDFDNMISGTRVVFVMSKEEREGSAEERLFGLSQEELITLVVQNQTSRAGLVAENELLNRKVKNLVGLKIQDNEEIERLNQDAQEAQLHWEGEIDTLGELYDKLEIEASVLHKSVQDKVNVLVQKSREINALEEKLLAADQLIADIFEQFKNFSSQERKEKMLPRLEAILNLVNRTKVAKNENISKSNKKESVKKK